MSDVGDAALPSGWASARINELVQPRRTKADPAASPEALFIGLEHVEARTGRLLGTALARSMKSAANVFYSSDVLYGRLRAYLSKVYQPDFDGLCSGEFIVLPESPAIAGRFLKQRLQAGDFLRFATSLNSGDRPRVDFEQIGRFEIWLPPRNEQERIADLLDELFSELDAAVAGLERVRAKLKLYRASVLKAAVEGTLTAAWRAENAETEPGTELLSRILSDHRQRWEEDQLAKFAAKGLTIPKNWKTRYKEPAAPDRTNLPPLPVGWCWASVEQCGEVRLGRQRAPRHHSGDHMRPYLRVANVFEDRIDTRDVKRMNFTPEEYETYSLRYGDILLNEGQSPELVGRPAMYRDEIPGCCYQKTLIRFRTHDGVSPSYALTVFRGYLHGGRFRRSASITTSIAHLAAERFVVIEFPLPPQAEQEAIVEALEDQLSVIDHLEVDIEARLKSAGALRQSILRAAFMGELVPQDPNDEPASELLKRIADERAARVADEKRTAPGRRRKRVTA